LKSGPEPKFAKLSLTVKLVSPPRFWKGATMNSCVGTQPLTNTVLKKKTINKTLSEIMVEKSKKNR
jgi:hypothetical protein